MRVADAESETRAHAFAEIRRRAVGRFATGDLSEVVLEDDSRGERDGKDRSEADGDDAEDEPRLLRGRGGGVRLVRPGRSTGGVVKNCEFIVKESSVSLRVEGEVCSSGGGEGGGEGVWRGLLAGKNEVDASGSTVLIRAGGFLRWMRKATRGAEGAMSTVSVAADGNTLGDSVLIDSASLSRGGLKVIFLVLLRPKVEVGGADASVQSTSISVGVATGAGTRGQATSSESNSAMLDLVDMIGVD